MEQLRANVGSEARVMNLDRDIGTMLRERVEGVAASPTIPHRTLGRVRVRKTLMTGGVGAVVAVLLFCGCAASGSLSSDAAPTRPANETETNDPTVNLPYQMTTTFVSPTYGYSFKYLDRGGLAPATELWDPVNEQLPDNNQFDDRFDAVETGFAAYFAAASTEVPDGVSIDEWVDQYVSPGGCGVPRSQQAKVTIDGKLGRIAECPNRIEATVVAGERLYLFALLHMRSDGRAFFDAWVGTVDLRPKAAAKP
jgi:hypothetical protein